MSNNNTLHYIKSVLENMPADWLNLTTHRLDIFNEELAKVEFIEQFENLQRLILNTMVTLDLLTISQGSTGFATTDGSK